MRSRATDAQAPPTFGFLTVAEYPEQGYFGGYLLLNQVGRPLEFHCTLPVRPNRAQEILYGPTLRPYLYGEQIGLALFQKAKLKASVVCTDVAPALALRGCIDTPVVWVCGTEQLESELSAGDSGGLAAPPLRLVGGGPSSSALDRRHARRLGEHWLQVEGAHAGDLDRTLDLLQREAPQLDLQEPFERIRDAITEARGASRNQSA